MPGSSLSRTTISYCETEERLTLGPGRNNVEVSTEYSSVLRGRSLSRATGHELGSFFAQGLGLLNFLIAPTLYITPEATSRRGRHYCSLHHPEKHNLRRFGYTMSQLRIS